MGNSHPNIAPYSVYKTQDEQYIVIGVATDSQYYKLCNILGIDPALAKFLTNRERCNNRIELNATIQNKLNESWVMEGLIKAMAAMQIPFSEIKSIKQLFED